MSNQGCDIGLIGLGTMGRNFVLNMADHGFAVAVYNRTTDKTKDFMENEVGDRAIQAGYDLQEFIGLLRRPRALILLVSAGDPVDAVLRELLPQLTPGDLIIDSGNSHFTDTNRRFKILAGKNLKFMGMGISGGEAGARYGPSLMPGGSREMYERVRPILEAAAAHVNGEPCVTYLGPRSAGHYVKMVHNGIEYGLMELIVETYDLLKRGLGLTPAELAAIYALEPGGTQLLPGGNHRQDLYPPGRSHRQAPDRHDPGQGQAKRHRHVDLLGCHGPPGGDSHHRRGGGHAGYVGL